jgi:rubredoxin
LINRKETDMKKWQCIVCGYEYDEAAGDPEHGIKAGTRWEDVPADWACPDCGIAKEDFEMVLLAA